MNKSGIIKALKQHLILKDEMFSVIDWPINGEILRIFRVENYWRIVVLENINSMIGLLAHFEAAMQYLIEQVESEISINKLAIAMDFGPIVKKQKYSFRRPLKKYSNSVVFADLNIQLMIFFNKRIIRQIESAEINEFLIHLDRNIRELNSD